MQNIISLSLSLITGIYITKHWEKGCYEYSKKYTNELGVKVKLKKYNFTELFGSGSGSVNDNITKLAILYLFYPINFIFGKGNLPELILEDSKHNKVVKKHGGGSEYVHSSDRRIDVFSIIVPQYEDDSDYNCGRFIIKVSKHSDYAIAYEDEANIYKRLFEQNKKNLLQ